MLTLGLGLSLAAFFVVRGWETGLLRAEFERQANNYGVMVQREIAGHCEVLDSVGGLFAASDRVERNSFRAFVKGPLGIHKDIRALAWVARVPDAERPAWERAAKEEGLAGFRFTERAEPGAFVPAGKRPEYYPIYFSESQSGDDRALGFDVGSEPTRRAALEKARDTGQVGFTPPITLLLRPGTESYGFLSLRPIYRNGAVLDTIAQRRAELVGYAMAVFDIANLVEEAIRSLPPGGLNFELSDEASADDRRFLYRHSSRLAHPTVQASARQPLTARSGLWHRIELNVAGRRWALLFTPAAGYAGHLVTWRAWSMLVAGAFFTALWWLYVSHLARQTARIQGMADTLKLTKAFFEGLINTDTSAICVLDAQGRFTYCNERSLELTGYSAEAILGSPFTRVVHPDSIARASEDFRRVLNGESVRGRESIALRKDGSSLWIMYSAAPLHQDGKIAIAATDITALKQTEAALERERFKFKNILELLPDVVCILNSRYEIQYMNPAGERQFGPAAGRNCFDYFHDSRDPSPAGTFNEMRAGESIQRQVYSDKTRKHYDVFETVLQNTDGTISRLQLAHDISALKLATEKIREQAALIDHARDAFIVLDDHNSILFWSKGAEQLYGWPAAEALGKEADVFLTASEAGPFREPLQTVQTKGEWIGELSQVTKAGEAILVHAHWTLMAKAPEQPQAILCIHTDITEKKRLELQFLRAQRMENIGRLASGIAHDLNNVLAPILMAIPILREEARESSARSLLETLEASAQRGADIVKQILTFARGAEGQKTPLQPRFLVLDMGRIVQETFPKSIRLETQIAKDLWFVPGDATQLHQVLLNLCVNARDAMPEGGTLTMAAENGVFDEHFSSMTPGAKPGSYVVLSVSDTGVGIPTENVEKIFDPFFTTKPPEQGTGLGLATVLGIVKGHGGFIEVQSKIGRGTAFKIYLPALESSASVPAIPSPSKIPAGNGECILVVDDEDHIRSVFKRTLERHQYRTLSARDGTDAAALFAQNSGRIALVVTDIMMPFMDGIALIKVVRKMNPQIKIIVASGLGSGPKVSEAVGLGVQALLSKPFTAASLLQTVAKVLAEKGEIVSAA